MSVQNQNAALVIAKKALDAANMLNTQVYPGVQIRKYSNITTIADSMNDPTAAEWLTGMINCTGGGSDTWTLPTGPILANAMPGSSVSVGDSFDCYVINGSGGSITLEAGATGSTITNVSDDLVVENGEVFKVTFIFSTATRDAEEYKALLVKSV
jgi:hypothetical protein